MNEKTAYIDGSQVYGIDDEMMNSLRTMDDGLLIAQVNTVVFRVRVIITTITTMTFWFASATSCLGRLLHQSGGRGEAYGKQYFIE